MEKVRGLVIAPYDGLKETFLSVASSYEDRIHLDTYVGNLEDGLEIVKTIHDRYDLVISRGGTATLIRDNTDMIVVDIGISGYDYMRIFKMAENIQGKKAMVGYANIIKGAYSVNIFMKADVDLFTISSTENLVSLLKDLQKKDYKLVIGDTVACNKAQELQMNNLLLISGEESVKQSIEDSLQLLNRLKKYATRLDILEMIHNSKSWHTVVFDSSFNVLQFYSYENDPPISFDVIRDNITDQDSDLYIEAEGGLYNLIYKHLENGYVYCQFRKVWSQNERIRGIDVISFNNDSNPRDFSVSSYLHGPKILEMVDKIAKSSLTALFIGDTGAGKNELAQVVHRFSAHARYPFYLIDCSVVEIKEMENFISLVKEKKGTLCFSSLECMDDEEQRYLLKVLPLFNRNDIRIIGVANSKINDYLANKQFDARLFRFFAGFTVHVPNLHADQKELEPLIKKMILKANQAQGRQVTGIDDAAVKELSAFRWTYNFDQIAEVVNQLVLIARDTNIHLDEVKTVLASLSFNDVENISLEGTLDDIEKRVIETIIRREGGNVSRAAERLGIGRSTIWRKVKYK